MSAHEVLAVRLIREITFVETLEKARSGKAIRLDPTVAESIATESVV
jgi:hypothetical protein